MSFNNIIQPPHVGPKITNSLGFIRRDATFSYVDTVAVSQLPGNCCCPALKTYCLRLPCDLVNPQSQCVTTPLIDTKTGEPFLITKGTLLDKIIVAKCEGVSLDSNLTFILGALTSDPSDSASCNRWIAESNCVCGEFLNCACIIQVDASAKCRNVAMEQCKAKCGFQPGASLCTTPDTCPTDGSDCGSCGRCLNCCDGCQGISNVGSNDCCFPQTGPCPILRFGELEDSLLGITVCAGQLYQTDLTFTIQVWELSTGCGQECSECAGPNYLF